MIKFVNILLILFLITGCNTDDDSPQDPISQLPPATRTGENTIGCLVNGVPFTDTGLMTNFYQLMDGEYILVINWGGVDFRGNLESGQIVIRNVMIQNDQTYKLNFSTFSNDDFTGGAGKYVINNEVQKGQFETDSVFIGTINFTRFDDKENIMSGTFEFDAKEINTGETRTITDGRFDLIFTN